MRPGRNKSYDIVQKRTLRISGSVLQRFDPVEASARSYGQAQVSEDGLHQAANHTAKLLPTSSSVMIKCVLSLK